MSISKAYEKMMSEGKIAKVGIDERRRTMGPGFGDPGSRIAELGSRIKMLEDEMKQIKKALKIK